MGNKPSSLNWPGEKWRRGRWFSLRASFQLRLATQLHMVVGVLSVIEKLSPRLEKIHLLSSQVRVRPTPSSPRPWQKLARLGILNAKPVYNEASFTFLVYTVYAPSLIAISLPLSFYQASFCFRYLSSHHSNPNLSQSLTFPIQPHGTLTCISLPFFIIRECGIFGFLDSWKGRNAHPGRRGKITRC